MIPLSIIKRMCWTQWMLYELVDAATFPPMDYECIRMDANYVINSLISQDNKLVEMLNDPKNFQSSEEVNKYFDELAYFNKCFHRLGYLVYAHSKHYNGIFVDLIVEDGPKILHVDLLSNDAKKKYWLNDNKKYETAKILVNVTQQFWNYLKTCFPITPMPPVPTYYMRPFTDNY